jgi:hypothetical protein
MSPHASRLSNLLSPTSLLAGGLVTYLTGVLDEKIFNLKYSGNEVYYTVLNIFSKDLAV